jgi:hypothetical protein
MFDRVTDGVIFQNDKMMAREPRHRPHAATWLHHERWNDPVKDATFDGAELFDRVQ